MRACERRRRGSRRCGGKQSTAARRAEGNDRELRVAGGGESCAHRRSSDVARPVVILTEPAIEMFDAVTSLTLAFYSMLESTILKRLNMECRGSKQQPCRLVASSLSAIAPVVDVELMLEVSKPGFDTCLCCTSWMDLLTDAACRIVAVAMVVVAAS
ncbi:hypothetical protein EJB05_35999 [Eragrostis curvula]|uniref:Uncharacterized protein n=1 Tax=Eragrostis curvula TaxID=38414 RepID=A0A5J9U872_9POAL|nr:hypothetical protein EJB05_35999 [Eragrostis curvula]